jgi:hypothetical protein
MYCESLASWLCTWMETDALGFMTPTIWLPA